MIGTVSRRDESLRRTVADILGVRALSRDAIADEVVQGGASSESPSGVRERLRHLLQSDTSFADVLAGVIHVPSVLEGMSWTAWVDAEEAADGLVRTQPYLSPMSWWLVGNDVELVDDAGQPIGVLETDGVVLDGSDTDVVIGPEGWLDRAAGGWATVSVVGGALRWTPCETPPDPTDGQIAAMRTGFERAVEKQLDNTAGPQRPVGLRFATGDSPIHEALLADRAAFLAAPIPPLPALYRAAGLVERGATIAEFGFDWDALHSWRDRNRLKFLYQLDDDQVEYIGLVVGACHAVAAEGTDALGADEGERHKASLLLAGLMEDGVVAAAFWGECTDRSVALADRARFVDELTACLDGPVPAGLAWVRARCLELEGDIRSAVATLETAATAECEHVPALIDLAGFAADRGDARLAYRLLQRAGATDRPAKEPDEGFDEPDDAELLLDEIEGYALHRPRPLAKRNEPCPCGSGRKYKACHLGREQFSLDDRAGWLYGKAQRYLRRRDREIVLELAREMSDASGQYGMYMQLRKSAFVGDVALHEDGAFSEFLTARDVLLPDDEALLGAQWALTDRGVFEIEQVDRDRLQLRDIGRGERITVVNVTPTEESRRGTVLVGRPLPVGETYRAFSGFIPIPRRSVEAVQQAIDNGDPFEIAVRIGETMRPPGMQNTDGDDLVFHTTRWRVSDPEAVDAALRGAGLSSDRDAPEWRLARDTAGMPNATIAVLRLDGDELIGEVNSDERADELADLIAAALPGSELVDDDVRDFEDAMEDLDPGAAPPPLDQNDPAIRQVLEEHVAQQERRWLDESIPALGGQTPREAAADPIGRERLEQLLDSFPGPTPDNPGTFDPDRLRNALGL
jgi:SEC-C motif/Protein of unknown function (DUF2384)